MSNPANYAFQLNYTPVNTTSGATASGFYDFSPLLNNDSGILFDTSDFNAIFNNYNLNRPNSFYQDVDYSTDALIPVNIAAIRNNTAIKANTPDSNYTARRVILPRYEGSRIQSANYNFYTSPTASAQQFLNGDTGSWNGDTSFGSTAVIDSRPIYFAHFKDSKENYELWDSYTFRVDALIQAPFEDITGTENATSLPAIIKLDGSNNNLYETSKTFEVGRGAIVNYQTLQKGNVDYTSLKVGESKIFQGGLEYNLLNGSELDKTQFIQTQSYTTASYTEMFNVNSTIDNLFSQTIYLMSNPSNKVEFGTKTIQSASVQDDYGDVCYLRTGSGELNLAGGFVAMRQTLGYTDFGGTPLNAWAFISGPSLAVIDSMNKAIKAKRNCFADVSGGSFVPNPLSLGYPASSSFDSNDLNNYTRFQVSQSLSGSYEDFDIPFTVEKGDEIRVTYRQVSGSLTYNTSSFNIQTYLTQDFTVVGNPVTSPSTVMTGSGVVNGAIRFDFSISGSDYSRLLVEPDPETLEDPIPKGEIYNFTVRRRVQADDRVIVFQSPPKNSIGNNTLSGEGYLIPNDFTPQQKRNALTLISQLKNANTFRDDTNIES